MNLANAKEGTIAEVRESYLNDAFARVEFELTGQHGLKREFVKQALKDSTLESDIMSGMPVAEAKEKTIQNILDNQPAIDFF